MHGNPPIALHLCSWICDDVTAIIHIAYSELRGYEDDTEPADEEAASTYIKKKKMKWTWGEAAV